MTAEVFVRSTSWFNKGPKCRYLLLKSFWMTSFAFCDLCDVSSNSCD